MLKKSAIVLLSTLLGTSLYAENVSVGQGFIGLEVGAGMIQGDRAPDFFNDNLDYDGNAVEYGLRIGSQNEEWRTMFVFDYYDGDDDDQNVEKGYLMLDYFLLKGEESLFRPYVGINVGYANYESTTVEDDGFLYGGQVGVAVNVATSIDLDLSYRYSLSNADALDHVSSVTFGVSYLF